MKPRVVVVGSSNTDLTVRSKRLPLAGQTVIGGALIRAAGGKGANQAVAAARAGAQVHFVGKVGDDDFGRQTLKNLRKEGIRLSHVGVEQGAPSGVALILIDGTGENIIAVAPGANMTLKAADVEAAESLFKAASVALFQLENPLPAVQRGVSLAHRHGCRVILNPAPAPERRLPEALLKQVSLLTPNASEAEALTGRKVNSISSAYEAAGDLLAMGVQAVVVTLARKGAAVVTPEARYSVPALKVRPVDTVGAGDAFNGALACALAEGRSLGDAVRFAVVAGGLAVTRQGAQPSMPFRSDVLRSLQRLG
jgi:ribokinase